jgi:hypothetical protein
MIHKRSATMNSKRILTGAVFTLLLGALPAQAEPLDLKLGLWETTVTTDVSGSTLPESALKQMSPEQRARIEAAMKKREANGPKTRTTKTCLTKEKLNRPFSKPDEDKRCKHTVVTATRTVQDYKIQCTGPESHSGVMHLEATSRESIKSTIKMNAPRGAINVEMKGHWVSSDCGKEKG